MYFRLFYIMLSFILLSCETQETKTELNDDELIFKVEELYHKDQKWRRIETCLITANVKTRTSNNMSPNTKKGRLARRLFYRDIINKTDSVNTKELLELTNEYGFPGMDRYNHKFPICLVFVHSSKEYFAEIIKLVEREHSIGNMNDWEKDYIFWHVKRSRQGFRSNADKPIWFGTDEDIMNYFLKNKTP